MKSKIRLEHFPYSKNTGSFNMAVDEFMVMSQRPCVRLYGWQPRCLTLGYHQSCKDIDVDELKTNGIEITRRPTGGKAVLHWNDLTYSLILPQAYFSGTIKQSYEEISLILIDFFKTLGLSPEITKQSVPRISSANCFEAPGWFEISVHNKKIIGNAQARKNGMILQQGTIPFEVNTPLLNRIFTNRNGEAENTALKKFPGMPETPEEGANIFYHSLMKQFILEETAWRSVELEKIEGLVKEKYGSNLWVFNKKDPSAVNNHKISHK